MQAQALARGEARNNRRNSSSPPSPLSTTFQAKLGGAAGHHSC